MSLRYSAVGIEMAVSVVIGWGVGWWLDRKFGTQPIWMIVMVVLGVAAGFRSLFRIANEMKRKEEKEQTPERSSDENVDSEE